MFSILKLTTPLQVLDHTTVLCQLRSDWAKGHQEPKNQIREVHVWLVSFCKRSKAIEQVHSVSKKQIHGFGKEWRVPIRSIWEVQTTKQWEAQVPVLQMKKRPGYNKRDATLFKAYRELDEQEISEKVHRVEVHMLHGTQKYIYFEVWSVINDIPEKRSVSAGQVKGLLQKNECKPGTVISKSSWEIHR